MPLDGNASSTLWTLSGSLKAWYTFLDFRLASFFFLGARGTKKPHRHGSAGLRTSLGGPTPFDGGALFLEQEFSRGQEGSLDDTFTVVFLSSTVRRAARPAARLRSRAIEPEYGDVVGGPPLLFRTADVLDNRLEEHFIRRSPRIFAEANENIFEPRSGFGISPRWGISQPKVAEGAILRFSWIPRKAPDREGAFRNQSRKR